MNKKRILAMIMAVAMVVSMLAGFDFTSYASTTDWSNMATSSNKLGSVTITTSGGYTTLSYTPSTSGYYLIFSYNTDGDPYGYLLDSSGNVLKENDDDGDDLNFSFFYYMTANTTYKIKCASLDRTASYDVYVTSADDYIVNYYSSSWKKDYANTGDQLTLTAIAYNYFSEEWDLSSGYTFQWSSWYDDDLGTSQSITITVGDWDYNYYYCDIYKDGDYLTDSVYCIYNIANYMDSGYSDVETSLNKATTLTAIAYDYYHDEVDLTGSEFTFAWHKISYTDYGLKYYDDADDYYYSYDETYTQVGTSRTLSVTPTSQSDFRGYVNSDGGYWYYDCEDYTRYECYIYKNGTWVATTYVDLWWDGTTTEEETTESTTESSSTTTGAASTATSTTTTTLSVGTTATVGNLKYKVTKAASGSTAGTVTLTGVAKKTKKVVIPATVTLSDGKTYNVTAIGAKAFKGNKTVTKVTIGKNVTTIGAKAFYGCKKLKSIVIKSSSLKKVGKKAISGIKKNATIKVPMKKLKAYKKLFKSKTGFKKTMKIKK